MKRIVVDTNFLMAQFEYGVDLPSELIRISSGPLTLLIPSGAMDELSSFAGKGGRKAAAARFVLQNLDAFKRHFQVEVVESSGKVDSWIIKFARENDVCVATNDGPLRFRLLALKVPVIVVKSKSKLGFA